MKKVLFTVVVVLLLAAFGISAFMVGNYVIDGKKQEEQNNDLSQIVADARETAATEAPTAATEPSQTTEALPTETTEIQMRPEYAEIYGKNEDTVGWMKIAETKLDYPVLQSPENPNFYLDHDFYKNSSKRGALYAWGSADINDPSDNITIFGHNMADGSMFATLNNYTNKATWERNPLIFFDTLYEYHTYKIFAVFKTSANDGEGFPYHRFVDAENEADFDSFIKTCKDLSFYDTGITPKYGDKIICLSTCEYTLDNGRLVVAAYRIS